MPRIHTTRSHNRDVTAPQHSIHPDHYKHFDKAGASRCPKTGVPVATARQRDEAERRMRDAGVERREAPTMAEGQRELGRRVNGDREREARERHRESDRGRWY